MVRIRIECNNHDDMEPLAEALKSRAKVTKVSMVLDSAGRDQVGYFVEFEGEPSDDNR